MRAIVQSTDLLHIPAVGHAINVAMQKIGDRSRDQRV
jgi:hypothetical protein